MGKLKQTETITIKDDSYASFMAPLEIKQLYVIFSNDRKKLEKFGIIVKDISK